jgi:hypothetical protein
MDYLGICLSIAEKMIFNSRPRIVFAMKCGPKSCSLSAIDSSIRANVRRAAAEAGWCDPILELPYPGRWASHRKIFLERIVPQLEQLFTGR